QVIAEQRGPRWRLCLQRLSFANLSPRAISEVEAPAGWPQALGQSEAFTESVMSVKAGYSTTLLHVAEVERSLRFYELLGFVSIDTDRCKPIGFARMHCEGGAVMFLRAEEPVDPSAQAFMLC